MASALNSEPIIAMRLYGIDPYEIELEVLHKCGHVGYVTTWYRTPPTEERLEEEARQLQERVCIDCENEGK